MGTVVKFSRDRLERLRSELANTKAERAAVAAAPVTREEAGDRARAWIEYHARRLEAPRLTTPSFSPAAATLKTPIGASGEDVVLALLCRLEPDRMLALLAGSILAELGGREPLATEARVAKLRELDERLDRLEREEEGLIRQAEADGAEVERRPDADPAAVLGLPPRPEAA